MQSASMRGQSGEEREQMRDQLRANLGYLELEPRPRGSVHLKGGVDGHAPARTRGHGQRTRYGHGRGITSSSLKESGRTIEVVLIRPRAHRLDGCTRYPAVPCGYDPVVLHSVREQILEQRIHLVDTADTWNVSGHTCDGRARAGSSKGCRPCMIAPGGAMEQHSPPRRVSRSSGGAGRGAPSRRVRRTASTPSDWV